MVPGRTAIPREQLARVIGFYDPGRKDLWLATFDRLADSAVSPGDSQSPTNSTSIPIEPLVDGEPTASDARRTRIWSLVAAVAVGVLALALVVVPRLSGNSSLSMSPAINSETSSRTASRAPSLNASSDPNTTSNALAQVIILTPKNGSKVRACEPFVGTAQLPPGKTLVLGMQNQTDNEKTLHFEGLWRTQVVGSTTTWVSAQYFGSKDSSVGQTFTVRIMLVDSTVKAQEEQKAKLAGHEWYSTQEPPHAQDVVTLTYHRIAGPGPSDCG